VNCLEVFDLIEVWFMCKQWYCRFSITNYDGRRDCCWENQENMFYYENGKWTPITKEHNSRIGSRRLIIYVCKYIHMHVSPSEKMLVSLMMP
jgi:hypothetical protein